MRKQIGLVKIIGAMLGWGGSSDKEIHQITGMNRHELGRHQANLIVNAYAGPIPPRVANQRQRRKQWRQSPSARPKSNRK